MRKRKAGFTLIELLMVVLIIGLLVVMLVPVVTAVRLSVMATLTEARIWEIDNAVCRYRDVFGDYPPSGLPAGAKWSYPKGVVPPDAGASAAGTGYGDFDVNKDYSGSTYPPGGQYLTYFMFGPNRVGWSPSTHKVMVAWTAPVGLDRYLTSRPLRNIGHSSHYYYVTPAYWYFEDAFGLTGNRFAGAILYLRANPGVRHNLNDTKNEFTVGKNESNFRWDYDNVSAEYYWACRGSPGDYEYYHGDGEPINNLARLLRQNPKEFALISAGSDHAFGYRGLNTHGQNKTIEGADWDDGTTNDITNFDHD